MRNASLLLCDTLGFRTNAVLCRADTRFTQQELPACKPLLTPAVVRGAKAHCPHYSLPLVCVKWAWH